MKKIGGNKLVSLRIDEEKVFQLSFLVAAIAGAVALVVCVVAKIPGELMFVSFFGIVFGVYGLLTISAMCIAFGLGYVPSFLRRPGEG